MTAKEYLRQIKELSVKIKQMETQLECLRETAGGAAAIRYDRENIQVSISGDMLETAVIRLIELEDAVLKDKVKMESMKNTIIRQIQNMEDIRYVNVLYKRYVECKSYELIAVECAYSFDYVKELHSDALKCFEDKYPTFSHF